MIPLEFIVRLPNFDENSPRVHTPTYHVVVLIHHARKHQEWQRGS